MADDTATYDPASDELMTQAETPDQSDEMLGYLTALANESRLKQTLAINEAMKREEGPPDERMNWTPAPSPIAAPGGQWQPPSGVAMGGPPVSPPTLAPGSTPALVNRGGQSFTGAPLPQPTGQGRMYMGPTMAPDQESSFMLSPPGTRTSLMPPPQITGPEANEAGVASGLIQRPSERLTPTDIAWTPAYEQWAAQQDLKTAVDRGVPIEKAAVMFPGAFGSRGGLKSGVLGTTGKQAVWVPANSVTGAPGHFENPSGTVYTPAAVKPVADLGRTMEGRSLYSEKTMLGGLIASPNTNPKQVPALQKRLDTVNARIKEIFPPTTTEQEQSGEPAKAPTRGSSPSVQDRVSRAKEMRLRHPDFTKQQIIDAVNQESE